MSSLMKDPIGNISKSAKFRVMFSAVTVNVLTVAVGCTLSYASPVIFDVKDDDSRPFRLSIVEQSWLLTILYLGYIVGSLVCGCVADAFGRKNTMIFSSVFCVVGFVLVASAIDIDVIYAGIFIGGIFASIGSAAVLLYCSEIAAPNNRGVLIATVSMASTVGMVGFLVLGASLPWNRLAAFVAFLYAFPLVAIAYLPESPRWSMLKGNREAAVRDLEWFRGEIADTDDEMAAIERSLVDAPTGLDAFADLVKKWSVTQTNLLVVGILFVIQSFSGNFVMETITVTIFRDSTVDVNSEFQTDITDLFSIVGSICFLFLVERFGRHELLFVSTLFTAVGMGMLAVFFRVLELNPQSAISDLSWLPMFGLSISNFMFCIGLLPVPWIFACELFPTNLRGIAVTVVKVAAAVSRFVALKTFVNVQNAINTSGAFTFYAAFGVVGIAFVVFAVNVTKKTKILK